MEQPRRGGHGAGGARGDHGAFGIAGEARNFRCNQKVTPCCRFDAADGGEIIRPGFAGDLEKRQGVLPVDVEFIGHDVVERIPADTARHHVVHQARQIASQRQCRGRSAHHKRIRLSFRPCRHQPGQCQPSFKIVQLWRQKLRRGAAELRGVGKFQFVFIDIAERDNARQHDSVGVEHVEEYFARKTARAPRRQVERNIGESFGSDARGKSVDKAAVDKGFDHRMQKRRR